MKSSFKLHFCSGALRRFALGMERVFELLKHFARVRCFTSFSMTKCFKASSESPTPRPDPDSYRDYRERGNAQKMRLQHINGYKTPAGALQFVVFISVVIAVILAGFVALTHTHTFFKKQSRVVVEVIKNADAGIQYALVKDINLNDSTELAIFKEDHYNLRVHRSHWGVFEKVTSVSKIKNKQFTKTALVGGQFSATDRPALYLQDRNKPLIVVGHTKIEGTAYLPEKAVRPGNISGNAYHGTRLIHGNIKKSSGQLPQLPQEIIMQLGLLSQQEFHLNADEIIIPLTDIPITNSFTRPVKYIYSSGTIDLGGLKITGNIVIYAKERIIVPATARLNDVILAAPEIDIKDGVNGCFQAIASTKITVGKQSTLHYPSALILKEAAVGESEQQKEKNQITIGENSTVKGVVLFLGEEKQNNFSPQVVLEPHSAIYGELYCNQNLSLKGTVNGSVYTSNFIVNKLGTTYQNHVFNGTISSKNLPEVYTGFFLGPAKKNIIKWLY